jgi:RNA polymerase sigma-70 factor (ECF subfamily)
MPTATAEQADTPQTAMRHALQPPRATDGAGEQPIDNLEHIYSQYNSRVYYLCLRMTGNADDAEDLSQEAFLRMIQKLDTFRGESAFYTWLRRLAINVVLLKFQKASWRREISLEELAEPDTLFESFAQRALESIDLELMGAIDRITLERAMDRLAPGFKAVFILHDIEGYEHNEIASFLGCSVGTSKSQLHKARLKMRELLGETWREKVRQKHPASIPETDAMQIPVPPKERPVLRFPRPMAVDFETPLSGAA